MENLTRFSQRINAHLKAAKAYAELSYAVRAKVGCVIIRDDRIVSIGYNGTPSGRNNLCEYEELEFDAKDFFEVSGSGYESGKMKLVTKPEVIHAEMNAIAFAARQGTSTDGCSMVITLSPCYECAKTIVQCGIKEVFYEEEYRDTRAVEFLRECGIKVEKI